MAQASPSENIPSSPSKDGLFWCKIVSTQYLIRHPFWKSFLLPLMIGQIANNTQIDYTDSKHLTIIYILIAFHFLSGIFVSDRKFRHALGFLPHIIGLAATSYVLYTDVLHKLSPWIRIRIVIQSLGTMGAFCFIASLHTTNVTFRSILRRISSYLTVFYFVLNAYILWWSNDESQLFDNLLWKIFIRSHAFLWLTVSGGFCLEIFILKSCQFALYLIGSSIFIDIYRLCGKSNRIFAQPNFWIFLDFVIDDLAIFCGCFYLYQFYVHQKKSKVKQT